MKKLLLLAALALPMLAGAKEPTLQITPEPLPAGVSVSPAQGFVEVSNNLGFPLGVSNVAIDFGYEIEINEECTTPALLYKNDFETPVAETTVRSVETLTNRAGGVIFKNRTFNTTGIYKIVVPEGMFVRMGTTEETPGMTLYYEIFIGTSLLPAPGVVPELENIVLTLTDADEVIALKDLSTSVQFYKDNSATNYELIPQIMDYDNDGKTNQVVFSFGNEGISTTFIEPGTFSFQVDAGTFEYRTYGPNYAEDPTDFVSRTNDELIVKYVIPVLPIPEIAPSPVDDIEEFDAFTLFMPAGFTKWMQDDKTACNIYPVNDDGSVDTSTVILKVKVNKEYSNESSIYMEIYDPNDLTTPLESYKPEPGVYCLRLQQGLFSGMYKSLVEGAEEVFANCEPFDYFYVIKGDDSAVETIESAVEAAAAEELTIYTMTGILVARDAKPAVLATLPQGLYIVNGKKLMVK